MSLYQTVNLNNSASFTYDNTKINITTDARLKLNSIPGTQVYSYTGAGVTGFNALKSEISGSTFRMKDTRPASLSSYFAWDTQLNGNYGTGALTVTANGGAAIAAGVLNLVGSGKYVNVQPGYAPQNVGTIALIYKPAYSNHPGTDQYIYSSGNIATGLKSYIELLHETTGAVSMACYSDASTPIFVSTAFIANWNPVAGTEYIFTIQIDTTTGASKLFLNGVQQGSTQTGTGVRVANTYFNVGSNKSGTTINQNFSIRGLVFYNAIVSPTGITPLNDTIYVGDVAQFPTVTYTGIVDSFLAPVAGGDDALIRYSVNGYAYYSGAWQVSDGSFAQSMTKATWITQIAGFNTLAPYGTDITVRIVTNSSNTVQMALTSFSETINNHVFLYDTNNPTIMLNSTILTDGLFSLAQTATITGSDDIRWAVEQNGVHKWWNSASLLPNKWEVSNGTYAQSSSLAELNANFSLLDLTVAGADINMMLFLHSFDGTTTPIISQYILNYDYYGPPKVQPNKVYCYLRTEDLFQTPIIGAVLNCTPVQAFWNNSYLIPAITQKETSRSDGYVELYLEETATANVKCSFLISYVDPNDNKTKEISFKDVIIPNVTSVDLSTILEIIP